MDKQKGFSMHLLLFTAVLLCVIGFAGWYVWHSQQAISQANSQSTSAASATKYLVIQAWAVRLAYSGQYKLTYTTNLNNPSVVGITSAQLIELDRQCEDGGVGTIERFGRGSVPAPGPETIEQLAAEHPSTYTHIGAYYYTIQRSRAACSTNPEAQSLQIKLFNVIDHARVAYIP